MPRGVPNFTSTYANDYIPVSPIRKAFKEPGKPVVNLWDLTSEGRVVKGRNCVCNLRKATITDDQEGDNYLKGVRTEYVGKYCFDFPLELIVPNSMPFGDMKTMAKFFERADREEQDVRKMEESIVPCRSWKNLDLEYDAELQQTLAKLYLSGQSVFLTRKPLKGR